jgi:hypothetical protein
MKNHIIIKLVKLANGMGHPHNGKYVKEYDPNYYFEGRYEGGWLRLTEDPKQAKNFDSFKEAYDYWMQQAPAPHDVRPDGKPNRPLTAWTVEIEAA